MGGGLKREGTRVPMADYFDVWQRPVQYCESIFLQLKINKFGEKFYLFNALGIYFGVGDGAKGVWSQVEATRVEVI